MQWESISHILTKTAEKSPEKTAVLSDDFFVDYSSLDDGVDFLAEAIADAGVSPFDRVGVYIRSGYEFLVTVLALSRLDAVPALLDVLDDPEAGGRIPAEAGLDFIITHGADAALAEEVFLDDGEPCAVPGAPDFALVFREPSVADAPSDAGIIFITAEDRKPVFVSHEAMLESVEEIAGSLRLSAWDTVAVTESMTSRESFSLGLGTLLVGGSLSFGRAPHHVDASRTYMAGPRPVTVLDAARRPTRPGQRRTPVRDGLPQRLSASRGRHGGESDLRPRPRRDNPPARQTGLADTLGPCLYAHDVMAPPGRDPARGRSTGRRSQRVHDLRLPPTVQRFADLIE